jgi:pimeloyl-ACP methyl ester carboxylesterase
VGKVFSSDGTGIAFDRAGQGPPLILVDGALCSRSFGPMPKLAPLLAPHFTVFTYDRRGRGESGDTQPYSVEREVEDIQALIREAGAPAFVLGLSSGAALAAEAAARGLAIERLALYEPPYMVDPGAPRPPADFEAQLRRLVTSGRRGDAVRLFMRVVGLPRILVALMRLFPMWPKLEAVAHTLAYDAAVMDGYSLPARRLAAVTVPTMVLSGEKSDPRLRHAAAAVAAAIPGADHRVLAGQTHNVSPKVLAPAAREFLAKSPVTSPAR